MPLDATPEKEGKLNPSPSSRVNGRLNKEAARF